MHDEFVEPSVISDLKHALNAITRCCLFKILSPDAVCMGHLFPTNHDAKVRFGALAAMINGSEAVM